MKIILNRYNELDYAQKLIKNGFLTGYKTYELKILGKYYKYMGLKQNQIKDKILDFYKNNVESYNEVTCFKKINEVLNYCKNKNNKLVVVEFINLNYNIVNYIINLNIKTDNKKFLFALYAKHSLNKKIYNENTNKESKTIYFSEDPKKQREVFKMCNYKRRTDMNKIIHELYVREIIGITKKGKIKLNFLENICSDSSDFLKINTEDMNSLGYLFDMLFTDEKVIRCDKCGDLIKVKTYGRKSCRECYDKYRRQYKTEKQRLYRLKHQ